MYDCIFVTNICNKSGEFGDPPGLMYWSLILRYVFLGVCMDRRNQGHTDTTCKTYDHLFYRALVGQLLNDNESSPVNWLISYAGKKL